MLDINPKNFGKFWREKNSVKKKYKYCTAMNMHILFILLLCICVFLPHKKKYIYKSTGKEGRWEYKNKYIE